MALLSLPFKTTSGGLEIFFDLYSPPGGSIATPVPLILYFHGGGLLFGNRSWCPQWLVRESQAKGWILVSSDYRLKPESAIEDILQDVKDVWNYIHTKLNDELRALDRPTADLTSCFVSGGSAGGLLSLHAGYICSPPPTGIISLYGSGCVDPAFWTTPQSPDYVMAGTPLRDVLKRADELEAFIVAARNAPQVAGSPITFPRKLLFHYLIATGKWFQEIFNQPCVSSDPSIRHLWPQGYITPTYPPTFLAHGTSDSVVPSTDSEYIASLLKENGVEHELLLLPGLEHDFDSIEGVQAVLEARRKIWEFMESKVTSAS